MRDVVLTQSVEQSSGQCFGTLKIGVRQQQGKLFSTEPRRQVGWSRRRLAEYLAEKLERQIASGMAIGVVVQLEVVDIQQQQCERQAAAGMGIHLEGQTLIEGAAIGNLRERICQRQRLERRDLLSNHLQ